MNAPTVKEFVLETVHNLARKTLAKNPKAECCTVYLDREYVFDNKNGEPVLRSSFPASYSGAERFGADA